YCIAAKARSLHSWYAPMECSISSVPRKKGHARPCYKQPSARGSCYAVMQQTRSNQPRPEGAVQLNVTDEEWGGKRVVIKRLQLALWAVYSQAPSCKQHPSTAHLRND